MGYTGVRLGPGGRVIGRLTTGSSRCDDGIALAEEANVAVVPGSPGRWWRYLACLAVEEPQADWPHWCHLPRLGTSVMAAAAIRHGCLLRLMMLSLGPAGHACRSPRLRCVGRAAGPGGRAE